MISAGREQSQRFSWKSHVNQLIGLCETLLKIHSRRVVLARKQQPLSSGQPTANSSEPVLEAWALGRFKEEDGNPAERNSPTFSALDS